MLNYRKNETEKPYKVFYTEEEWKEAVLEEIKNMQGMQKEVAAEDVSGIKQKFLEEEAKIKQRVPDFDLKSMLRNDPEFRERVLRGYSVEEAFYLSNRMKNEENAPKKKIGIRENGRGNYMGAGANRSISSMSDEEFKKYINSIKGSKF